MESLEVGEDQPCVQPFDLSGIREERFYRLHCTIVLHEACPESCSLVMGSRPSGEPDMPTLT